MFEDFVAGGGLLQLDVKLPGGFHVEILQLGIALVTQQLPHVSQNAVHLQQRWIGLYLDPCISVVVDNGPMETRFGGYWIHEQWLW